MCTDKSCSVHRMNTNRRLLRERRRSAAEGRHQSVVRPRCQRPLISCPFVCRQPLSPPFLVSRLAIAAHWLCCSSLSTTWLTSRCPYFAASKPTASSVALFPLLSSIFSQFLGISVLFGRYFGSLESYIVAFLHTDWSFSEATCVCHSLNASDTQNAIYYF